MVMGGLMVIGGPMMVSGLTVVVGGGRDGAGAGAG